MTAYSEYSFVELPFMEQLKGLGRDIALTPEGEKTLYHGMNLLLLRSITNFDKMFYIEEGEKFWIIDISYYLKSKCYIKFLYYLFQKIDFMNFSEATGVPSLNRETFYRINVNLPKEIKEQEKIASILSSVDSQIETETTYRGKLQMMKKGMMKDLLSGRVRVKF